MKRFAILLVEVVLRGSTLVYPSTVLVGVSSLGHQKPHFCGNTEIGHAHKHDLLEHRILAELVRGLLKTLATVIVIDFFCTH